LLYAISDEKKTRKGKTLDEKASKRRETIKKLTQTEEG